MKKAVKIIIIVLIIAVLGFIAYKLLTKPQEVNVSYASRGNIETVVEVKGVIEGKDSCSVTSGTGRRVIDVKVEVGDTVKADQVLCVLEESDSEKIAREKAEIALKTAESDLENTKQLYAIGAAAEDSLQKAEDNLRLSQLAIEELDAIGYEVKSPIAGTVTRVNIIAGKYDAMGATEPLFVIEDTSELETELAVKEDKITQVALGQTVRIETKVSDAVYGKVTAIAPSGEKKSSTSSERVVPVTVTIDKDAPYVLAGVTSDAAIITGEKSDALIVPSDAVYPEGDATYVFVVSGDKVYKKAVSVELYADDFSAIAENGIISEGDCVVLFPDDSLKDGTSVSAKEVE